MRCAAGSSRRPPKAGGPAFDELSHKYLGIPYPNFSGNPDETRLIITIEADKITPPPGE